MRWTQANKERGSSEAEKDRAMMRNLRFLNDTRFRNVNLLRACFNTALYVKKVLETQTLPPDKSNSPNDKRASRFAHNHVFTRPKTYFSLFPHSVKFKLRNLLVTCPSKQITLDTRAGQMALDEKRATSRLFCFTRIGLIFSLSERKQTYLKLNQPLDRCSVRLCSTN